MRITIAEILECEIQGTLIKFKTTFGSGKAIWRSVNNPNVLSTYDVEFEVDGALEWGLHILPTEVTEYLVAEDGERVVLQGKVEMVGRDGVLVLRVGENLILLDTKGEALQAGSFVRVTVNNVAVYDSNI